MKKTATAAKANRIAFIQAAWHLDIVSECRKSFLKEMTKQGYTKNNIDVFTVPGVLEIPLQSKLLAKTGNYAAIVASGLVVNGGIYRHDFVADIVMKGMMDVMLEFEIPVLSAVLTPHHFHEHEEHHEFFFNHFAVKGKEVADACVGMVKNVKQLKKAA